MTTGQATGIIDQVCHWASPFEHGVTTDRQLVDRFVGGRDEAAFTAIVRRHGPMVLGVCQRVAGNVHDAEDAFQATFLVLARKADSLRQRELIANWLYGVARRIAMKTRVAVARRRQREGPIDDVALSTLPSQTEQNELSRVLDEEIGRLPERYGVPVVLCELQGRSRQEVAMRLGIPEGTLSSRLASARRMLARSLKRRGVVLSAAILSTTLSELAANAVVSSVLIRSTAIAAFGDASGKVAHSRATALAEGVMRTMYLTKLKLVAATFASLIVAGIATSVLTAQTAPPVSKDLPKAPAENLVAAKPALAEKEKWQNLMEQIDPEKHTVGQGIWRLKEGKLTAYPAAHGARLRIPVVPNGNFEFRARWEAKDESSSVAFIVPHGERMASVELMTGFGCAGLGDLNGVRPNINETKTDIRIKPGKVHTVVIHVSTNGATIHVLAKLDDKKIVDWEGKRSELEHEFFAPQKPASLALGIGGQSSIFHSLELRMLSGTADAWKGDAAAAK